MRSLIISDHRFTLNKHYWNKPKDLIIIPVYFYHSFILFFAFNSLNAFQCKFTPIESAISYVFLPCWTSGIIGSAPFLIKYFPTFSLKILSEFPQKVVKNAFFCLVYWPNRLINVKIFDAEKLCNPRIRWSCQLWSNSHYCTLPLAKKMGGPMS